MWTINIEKLPSYQMGMKKGIEKAQQESIHNQALVIAARLLAIGMAEAEIASVVELELAEVEALKTPPTD